MASPRHTMIPNSTKRARFRVTRNAALVAILTVSSACTALLGVRETVESEGTDGASNADASFESGDGGALSDGLVPPSGDADATSGDAGPTFCDLFDAGAMALCVDFDRGLAPAPTVSVGASSLSLSTTGPDTPPQALRAGDVSTLDGGINNAYYAWKAATTNRFELTVRFYAAKASFPTGTSAIFGFVDENTLEGLAFEILGGGIPPSVRIRHWAGVAPTGPSCGQWVIPLDKWITLSVTVKDGSKAMASIDGQSAACDGFLGSLTPPQVFLGERATTGSQGSIAFDTLTMRPLP